MTNQNINIHNIWERWKW